MTETERTSTQVEGHAPVATVETTTTRDVKPGYQTTEFWVTILVTLGGLYVLIFKGDTETAMALLGLVSVGYPISRALIKRGA